MTIYPALKVEIAFVANPYSTSLTWTNVTAYVRGDISVKRGRNYELGTNETGTASLTLENTDGRFDPFNTATPYAPYVLPYRPIRLTCTDSNGTVYPVFRGFIERWPQKWSSSGNYGTVDITCVDALKAVLSRRFGPRYQETVQADAAFDFYRANNLISLGTNSSANYILQTGVSSTSPGAVRGSPLTGLRVNASTGPVASGGVTPSSYYQQYGVSAGNFVYNTAEVATFQALNNCAYEMWFRPGSVPTDGSFVDLIINYGETWTTPTSPATLYGFLRLTFGAGGATYSLAANTIANNTASPLALTAAAPPVVGRWDHWVITRTGSTFTVYQNTVVIATFTCTAGQALWQSSQPGGASTSFTALWYGATQNKVSPYFHDVGEVALYKVNLTAAQIATHYNAAQAYREFDSQTAGVRIGQVLDSLNWPAADRSISTTGSTLQSSGTVSSNSAASVMAAASDAELGNLFVSAAGKVVFQNRAARNAANALSLVTFGERTGEIPYSEGVQVDFDDTYIFNDVQVTQANTSPMVLAEAIDATSTTSYGSRVLQRTVPLTSSADVSGQAATLLARYKQPVGRLSTLSVDVKANPTLIASVLAREIGDAATVKRRPLGAPTISLQAFIDGVEDRISASSWTRTFQLTPKLADATY